MIEFSHIHQLIKQKAEQYFDYAVKTRRHLHQHPELSFEEYKTAEFIQKELDKINIPYKTMGKTGVVGILKGNK